MGLCNYSFRLHLLVVAAQLFPCLADGELPLGFDFQLVPLFGSGLHSAVKVFD